MKKFIFITLTFCFVCSIMWLYGNKAILKAHYNEDKETISESVSTNGDSNSVTHIDPTVSPSPSILPQSTPTPTPTPIVAKETPPSVPNENGPTVFFGDSLTEGLKIFGFFKADIVIGINSLSTVKAINHVDEITALKPSKLFILLGINDIWEGDSVVEFVKRYEKLVIELKAKNKGTKIYVQSLLPVSANAINRNQMINNKIIDEANNLLRDMAKNQNVQFIDVNSIFKDELGNMKSEYSNDGVHLIVNYYPIWTGILEKYKNAK